MRQIKLHCLKYTKIVAQRHGKMACFMAKWSPDWPVQWPYAHFLTDLGGNAFYDPDAEYNRSRYASVCSWVSHFRWVLCMVRTIDL